MDCAINFSSIIDSLPSALSALSPGAVLGNTVLSDAVIEQLNAGNCNLSVAKCQLSLCGG